MLTSAQRRGGTKIRRGFAGHCDFPTFALPSCLLYPSASEPLQREEVDRKGRLTTFNQVGNGLTDD